MKEYRIQAILIEHTAREGTIETITNSLRSTDYKAAIDYLMKKHRASRSYLYVAMDLETQDIVYKSDENPYCR